MLAVWEFFTFRRMLGPLVLLFLFWSALFVVIAFGLWLVRAGEVMGWAVLVFGTLALRLVFELFLLMFRIYDRLGDIRRALEAVDEGTRNLAEAAERDALAGVRPTNADR